MPGRAFFGDIFERAVSVAASLASDLSQDRVPVGLLANCTWPGHDTAIRVPPSRAPGQMTRILEALAMADVFTLVRIERMLSEERLTYGSTLALVTAVLTPALESSLVRLKQHGAQVGLIYVGIEDPPARFAESPVYDIRSALEGYCTTNGSARQDPGLGPTGCTPAAGRPEPTEEVSVPTFVGGDDPMPNEVADSDGPVVVADGPPSAAGEPQSPWSRPERPR